MNFANDNSPKIKAPLGLDWRFNFGKYKDEQSTIQEVLDDDPSYLIWCCDEIDWFEVKTFIYDMALEADGENSIDSEYWPSPHYSDNY